MDNKRKVVKVVSRSTGLECTERYLQEFNYVQSVKDAGKILDKDTNKYYKARSFLRDCFVYYSDMDNFQFEEIDGQKFVCEMGYKGNLSCSNVQSQIYRDLIIEKLIANHYRAEFPINYIGAKIEISEDLYPCIVSGFLTMRLLNQEFDLPWISIINTDKDFIKPEPDNAHLFPHISGIGHLVACLMYDPFIKDFFVLPIEIHKNNDIGNSLLIAILHRTDKDKDICFRINNLNRKTEPQFYGFSHKVA